MSDLTGTLAEQAAALGISVDERREQLRLENIRQRQAGLPRPPHPIMPHTPGFSGQGIDDSAIRAARESYRDAFAADLPTAAEVCGIIPNARICVTLPWSCLHSINGTWTIRSPEYQGAKRRAQQRIGEQLPPGMLPLTCRLAVDVTLVVPDRRPRDLDNYRKLIFDAMKGLVYRDDSLIDDDRMRRAIDVDRPRAEIVVTPLGGEP